MTSIFSGNLYNNFVKDQNTFRLEIYDVNRFQRTIEQSDSQTRRETEYREAIEFQNAFIADLQQRLNELTEKLNNLYNRFIQNQVAFRKISDGDDYHGTSSVLNTLRNANDPTGPLNSGYPAGPPQNNVVPFDDPGRVRNYTYNPYFGSKAVDESDQTNIRTFWEEPGKSKEISYKENGAFWSTISYLWGWDLDRINATYATTDSAIPILGRRDSPLVLSSMGNIEQGSVVTINFGGQTTQAAVIEVDAANNRVYLDKGHPQIPTAGTNISWDNTDGTSGSTTLAAGTGNGTLSTTDNLQVNVTAIQPNRPEYPPLRVGDRFPLRTDEHPNDPDPTNDSYPYINIRGIRPGGADFSHAQFTDNDNEVGQDSLNWGWEFDDLPLSMEVTGITTLSDGTVQPTGYKVVYDIPLTHPQYDRYRHLDGTEPQILDAPSQIVKQRIYRPDFAYNGIIEFGDESFTGTYGTTLSPLPGRTNAGHPSGTDVSTYPVDFVAGGHGYGQLMGTMIFEACSNFSLTPSTRFSFNYDFTVEQRGQTGGYGTAGDDGFIQPYGSHTYTQNTDALGAPTGTGNVVNQGMIGDNLIKIGEDPTSPANDPFHSGGGATSTPFAGVLASNTGVGHDASAVGGTDPTNRGIVVANASLFSEGDLVSVAPGNTPTYVVDHVDTARNIVYTETAIPGLTGSDSLKNQSAGGVTSAVTTPGNGITGGVYVDAPSLFTTGANATMTNLTTTYTGLEVESVDAANGYITFTAASMLAAGLIDASGDPTGPIPDASWRVDAVDLAPPPFGGGANEQLHLKFRETAGGQLAVDVYFHGDIHGLDVNVRDLKIVTYGGVTNGWEQGLYDTTTPDLDNGSLTSTVDPNDVLNKYDPDEFNFTQFYNTYDAASSAADLKDIVRSPFEYGMLNIGNDTSQTVGDNNSELNGELFIDINDRRLNFDHDDFDNTTVQPEWTGVVGPLDATVAGTAGTQTFFRSEAVQEAYDFISVEHPPDDCVPASSPAAQGTRSVQYIDSDGYSNQRLDDNALQANEVDALAQADNRGVTAQDPMRTSNTGPAAYYDEPGSPYLGGASNDQTGTIDRVMGSTDAEDANSRLQYRMTIPTTDLNILRKENDVVFNFGSAHGRDYSIDINEPFIEYRTVPDYKTLPRYRVDASGNIYDRFGDGYHDPLNDTDALNDLYTTNEVNPRNTELSVNPLINGQVSNHDGVYDNANYYDLDGDGNHDASAFGEQRERMSPDGDDYNLFDYVPDLVTDPNADPNDPDLITRGELYVGSLPTNFYYYREELDNPAGDPELPTTSLDENSDGYTAADDNEFFRGDLKPALNFDGRLDNADGQYDREHKVVHNTEIPSFVNVQLGYVEQDAKWNNLEATTTKVTWDGFEGLGQPSTSAQSIDSSTGTITNIANILGDTNGVAAEMETGSSVTVEMNQNSEEAGHLLVYESFPDPNLPPTVLTTPVTGAGNGNTTDITVSDATIFNVGDLVEYDPTPGVPGDERFFTLTAVNVTGPGNSGTIRFQENSPQAGDNSPPLANAPVGSQFNKYEPQYSTKPHAVPLPLEAGYQYTFESYATRRTMTRTGSETKNGATYLHVDDASAFTFPVPPSYDVVIDGETRTITPSDVDTTTHPHTIRLTPPLGAGNAVFTANAGMDIGVVMEAGEFSVEISDGNTDNSLVTLSYDDLGSGIIGGIDSVELSPEMDRVGRYVGDDPRTNATEADAIGPEDFSDQPAGYVQPDARLSLNLVGQDNDGNQSPRRLREIRITVDAGEQIILGPNGAISQSYHTNDANAANGTLADPDGDWPIALYDEQNRLVNATPTADLGVLVGFYQGIVTANGNTTATDIEVTDASEFNVDDLVTINGEERQITAIAGNVITLDSPLSGTPLEGDLFHLGNGRGERDIKAYLNRSFAMSTGAPIEVEMLWEDYDVTGYPPTAATTGNTFTETVGHVKPNPANATPDAEYTDLNYLVANTGRSGGSRTNEFTQELKRIVDNPEYKELLRHRMMRNMFITASVTDPFSDIISSKLMLEWDRHRRRISVRQSAYTAYYKSV